MTIEVHFKVLLSHEYFRNTTQHMIHLYPTLIWVTSYLKLGNTLVTTFIQIREHAEC
ncbi:hypothetical protein CANARDRAFT_30201, partial [[Candida] arabinofermentans NRRL YB-2248]